MNSETPLRSYESAGGVVVTPAGELVLVLVCAKRLGPDDRPEVRLPKGHVEPGESPREAAIREVHEESGLTRLKVLSDLGRQEVRFVWKGTRYLRNESYFLMTLPAGTAHHEPEAQFERVWLTWADALILLTFEAEREWVRRAQIAWNRQLQNVPDQDPDKTDHHAQV